MVFSAFLLLNLDLSLEVVCGVADRDRQTEKRRESETDRLVSQFWGGLRKFKKLSADGSVQSKQTCRSYLNP